MIIYEGCGCAGGQVTTISGEAFAEGRRRQKVYEDILGRTYKSEVLNWDGSVYSTSITNFNGRDQAVLIRNYSGAETSTVFQETVVIYDGHGRVKTQHLPQQDANKATIFDYNPDDSLAVKTDARGATSTYTYDNRKLVTRIDHNMPAPPPQPQPTNNYSPLGSFEGVDSNNGNAWGWSFDPDNSPVSNTIHFYLDGPAGTGTYIGSITANQTRSDVNQAHNIVGDHGFVFSIPQDYWDDTQHALYAYGIDTGTNAPTLLSGSPKYFTIADPTPPTCDPPTWDVMTCNTSGGNWNYDTCSCDYGGYYYSRMIDPTNRKKLKSERVKKLKNVKAKKEKKTRQKDNTPIMALRCDPEDPECDPDPDPDPTPTPNPTPTPPPPANVPFGVMETIDTNKHSVKGWAIDPNNPNTSISVNLFIADSSGTVFSYSVYANHPRPDVNQTTGLPGNHGFDFEIPRRWQDGLNHTVYGQIVYNSGNSYNNLQGSPKTFNLTFQMPATPTNTSVIYTYDALGNRTSMTDANGNTTYEYNQISQLTVETKQFSDDLPSAPMSNNRFKLQYAYSYSGQLKSITDPYGEQINYGHDKAGRLNSVTGTPFGNVTNYATNPQYRAWGGLKGLTYGNGFQMSMNFDNRLQASSYQVTGSGITAGQTLMQKNYQYYNDGSLRYTQDALDPKFDRLNKYDHLGRVSEGKSGGEARGETVAQANMTTQLPYRQSYQYDAFSNMTQRNNLHWGIDNWYGQSNNLTFNYNSATNRLLSSQYDADGRPTSVSAPNDYSLSSYDATGVLTRMNKPMESEVLHYYDGNGREVKRRAERYVDYQTDDYWVDEGNTYYIRSSILGNEVISEVNRYGDKVRTNVIANGTVLAIQENHVNFGQVQFQHMDASGSSYRTSNRLGYVNLGDGTDVSPAELDPLGGNMGRETPYVEPEEPPLDDYTGEPFLRQSGDPMRVHGELVKCFIDGIEQSEMSFCQRAGESTNVDTNNSSKDVLVKLGYWQWNAFLKSNRSPKGPIPGVPPGTIDGGNTMQDAGDWQFVFYRSIGQTGQKQVDKDGMNPCEKKMATEIFTNQKDMYFSDVLDGDSRDRLYPNGSIPNGTNDTHNHIYNPLNEPLRETEIFAPAGGTHVWKGSVNGQNHFVLFYPTLNGEKNVILDIVHIEKYSVKKMADGRLKIGTMGMDGKIVDKDGHTPKEWHIHINAYKWFEPKITATSKIIAKLKIYPLDNKLTRQNIPLSKLFCK